MIRPTYRSQQLPAASWATKLTSAAAPKGSVVDDRAALFELSLEVDKLTQKAAAGLALGSGDLARRSLWSVLQGSRTNFGIPGVTGRGSPMWSGQYASNWQVSNFGSFARTLEGDSSGTRYTQRGDTVKALYTRMVNSPLVPLKEKKFYRQEGFFRREAMLDFSVASKNAGAIFPVDENRRHNVASEVVNREKKVIEDSVYRRIGAYKGKKGDATFGFSLVNPEKLKTARFREENNPATYPKQVEAAAQSSARVWAEKVANSIKKDLAKIGGKA